MAMDRRTFVAGSLGVTLSSLLQIGCGCSSATTSAESPNPTEPPEPAANREVTLAFEESDEFYAELDQAIAQCEKVVVTFDGPDRVGKESRLLKVYAAGATNWEAFFDQCTAMESDSVHLQQLQQVFAQDVLEHEAVKSRVELPSGEVIELATVILVLGIIILAAAASVAHHEIARGRSYRIKLATHVGKVGLSLSFEGA